MSAETNERTYRVQRGVDGGFYVLDEFEGDLIVAQVLSEDTAELVARWFAGDFRPEFAELLAGDDASAAAGLLRSLSAQLGGVLDVATQVIDQLGELADLVAPVRRCRGCGCTDEDCSQCVERTGEPCSWVEPDLCSACASTASDVDPRLSGNPDPATHAGVDLWPFGDAVDSSLVGDDDQATP